MLAVLTVHSMLVVVVTAGFFTLDPLVSVGGSTETLENTVLDTVYSLLHGLVCLVPSFVCMHAIFRGRSLGTKRATNVACSLVLLLQAAKLASLFFHIAAAAQVTVGPWIVTLSCLGVDVLVLVVFLTLSLALRLDSISGASDMSRAMLLPLLSFGHFLVGAATFLVVANADPSNTYITFAGGLSVLYSVLLFIGEMVLFLQTPTPQIYFLVNRWWIFPKLLCPHSRDHGWTIHTH